jgi:hypothetical protein
MVVMTVMAATHPTALATAFASAAGGSFGRDERRGADGGDGSDSENRLADHTSLLVFIGCVLTSCWSVAGMIQRVRSALFRESQIDHFVMAITSAEATV